MGVSSNVFVKCANGGAWSTAPLGGTPDGSFNGRKISLLANTGGSAVLHAGVRVYEVSAFVTIGGVEQLYKRIKGDAATINADLEMIGGDAL